MESQVAENQKVNVKNVNGNKSTQVAENQVINKFAPKLEHLEISVYQKETAKATTKKLAENFTVAIVVDSNYTFSANYLRKLIQKSLNNWLCQKGIATNRGKGIFFIATYKGLQLGNKDRKKGLYFPNRNNFNADLKSLCAAIVTDFSEVIKS